MRFPACVLFRCLSFLLIFFLLLPTFTSVAHAQTPTPAAYQFLTPNVDSNVPRNQHTFIQSLFLETLLALQCQLTGIDFTNPTKSCLGMNLQTGKIGYAPSDPSQQGGIMSGGLLGAVTQGISVMYTPTFGSRDYIHYLSDNFGLVKQTHASAYTGFQGLQPVLGLWKTMRDIAYYLLIIAFIFIGIGVMLRLKIDPRTVMTVQNQIPRVIICIILITFSYAFAGLLVDTMWAVTYMGINKITENANVVIDSDDGRQIHLREAATKYLLTTPFRYANEIYDTDGGAGGILSLGWSVGQAIGRLENDIIVSLFYPGGVSTDCGFSWTSGPDWGGCLQLTFKWIFGFLWFFAVAIALLIALFRIWMELLKAYIMVLLYVILAPIWIVFGLLPKRPLGFEKWLRVFFSNLAIFPAVVFILVGARVFHELFSNTVLGASTTLGDASVLADATQYRFVPPLVGNPDTNSFGSILEFAMVLMAPQLLSIIREKMGAAPLKQAAAAMQTFTAARGAAGAPVKQSLKHLNQKDSYGNAVGALAVKKEQIANKLTSGAGKWIPGIAKGHAKREYMKRNAGSVSGFNEETYNAAEEKLRTDRKPFKDAVTSAPRFSDERKKAKAALKEFDRKYSNPAAVMETRYDPSPGMPKPHQAAEAAQTGAGAQTGGQQTAGGRGEVTVTIVGPTGEHQRIPIDFSQPGSGTVHDVVVKNINNMTIPQTQKETLISRVSQESQQPDSYLTAEASSHTFTPEQTTHLSGLLDTTHTPPTTTPQTPAS